MSKAPPRKRSAPRACAERILAGRDHGRGELRRKLVARGFDPAEVDAVLDQLAGEGYLDDARYAREFARQALEKGHGTTYIRAKLAARGVRPAGPPCDTAEEAASLRALMERRRLRPGALTVAAERAKILRFLRGRGYSGAAISMVFGRMAESDES